MQNCAVPTLDPLEKRFSLRAIAAVTCILNRFTANWHPPGGYRLWNTEKESTAVHRGGGLAHQQEGCARVQAWETRSIEA